MGRLSNNKRQRCDTEASAPKRSKREETKGATKQATSKKKATGKAAGRKHDLNSLKHCRRNPTKWGFKDGPKTHEVLKWSELSANHLQDLKEDVRPLNRGESLMNVLQQGGVKQGLAAAL
jgi:hypothetical protein